MIPSAKPLEKGHTCLGASAGINYRWSQTMPVPAREQKMFSWSWRMSQNTGDEGLSAVWGSWAVMKGSMGPQVPCPQPHLPCWAGSRAAGRLLCHLHIPAGQGHQTPAPWCSRWVTHRVGVSSQRSIRSGFGALCEMVPAALLTLPSPACICCVWQERCDPEQLSAHDLWRACGIFY